MAGPLKKDRIFFAASFTDSLSFYDAVVRPNCPRLNELSVILGWIAAFPVWGKSGLNTGTVLLHLERLVDLVLVLAAPAFASKESRNKFLH